jgi:hypothetical protein
LLPDIRIPALAPAAARTWPCCVASVMDLSRPRPIKGNSPGLLATTVDAAGGHRVPDGGLSIERQPWL